jgi:hypothetical protein
LETGQLRRELYQVIQVLIAVKNHLKRILFAKIYEYVTGRYLSMSSTPLRNSNPESQERTQKSVPQIYPCVWQLEAGQKEEFVFPYVRCDGARCNFLWTRRRMCSSLI